MATTTQMGFEVRLDVPYEEAVEKITQALKAEGFGILTQIDVKATIKQKLDVDFRRYVILGACNPPLAHRALTHNLDVGLVLPCNTVVYEDGDGSVVKVVDPLVMLDAFSDDSLVCDVAGEAKEKLERAINSLK